MHAEHTERPTNSDEKQANPTSLKLARLRMAADAGRDISQEEMAEKMGVSRQKYSALESGTYSPGKALARKIGLVTGQTIGQVIDEYDRRSA